ncbi:MAG: SMC family ATPase [Candidatus Woesearchaeota archaeon]|jgi:exonuclease SbcC
MRINYIKLHNIRSYKDATVNFEDGSTLLYGDIGSGKSTILLAIEFCLFGFLRTDLTGEMLLRHGEKIGFAEISISIKNDTLVVRREIKQTQDTVVPGKCSITINGEIQSLMPTELREKIFSYLGYPRELVSKNPALIYRYTIYTQQEQLKQIIYEDPQTRVELLRKIFGIDKYKKIIENVELYTKHLREKSREYKGQLYDLEEIKQNILLEKEKSEKLEKEKIIKEFELNISNEKNDKNKKEFEKITLKIKEKELLLKENEFVKTQLEQNEKEQKEITINIESLQKEIDKLSLQKEDTINSEEKDIKQIAFEVEKKETEFQKLLSFIDSLKQKQIFYEKRNQAIKETLLKKEETHLKTFGELKENEKIDSYELKSEKERKEIRRKELEIIIEKENSLFSKIVALIENSKEIEGKVRKIDLCPTCFQKVTNEHKENICDFESEKQVALSKKQNDKEKQIESLKEEMCKIEKRLEELKLKEIEIERKAKLDGLKKASTFEINSLKEEQEKIIKEVKTIEEELSKIKNIDTLSFELKTKKTELELAITHNKKVSFQKNIAEKIALQNKIIFENNNKKSSLLEQHKTLCIKTKKTDETLLDFANVDFEKEKIFNELNKSETEVKNFQAIVTTIIRDILNSKEKSDELIKRFEYKQQIKRKIENTNNIHEFLSKYFVSLMSMMESKNMQKVHSVFNELFKKWFSMLIEDESVNVRIDENFNPLISQYGYDTNVMHLSGGEKTSLALAYRLSLTVAINQIISTINTKDVIILDEPTEGFSYQQLDRLRDVLDELKIGQIIIVSHESKIESFVSKRMFVSKKDQISCVN